MSVELEIYERVNMDEPNNYSFQVFFYGSG